jgi:YfiH family protein
VTIERFTAAGLADTPHGFFGAAAGNCGLGSSDDPARVAGNRARVAAGVLPGAALVGVYQIHSADCVAVAAPWSDADRPRADALVTDRPGILLSLLTADCAPVLLADTRAGVVGAAHAGWRGALAGIAEATVAAMVALGARVDRIAAAVGPTIAQRSYEVDEAFRGRFLAEDPANERFFADGPGDPPHFDLEAFVCARLATTGVGRIEALGRDTYADAARWFSYRSATQHGAADYGRQISLIGLAP